jgi:hypothetical protein
VVEGAKQAERGHTLTRVKDVRLAVNHLQESGRAGRLHEIEWQQSHSEWLAQEQTSIGCMRASRRIRRPYKSNYQLEPEGNSLDLRHIEYGQEWLDVLHPDAIENDWMVVVRAFQYLLLTLFVKLLSTVAGVRPRWGEFKEGAKYETVRCEHEPMKVEQDGFNL